MTAEMADAKPTCPPYEIYNGATRRSFTGTSLDVENLNRVQKLKLGSRKKSRA
jgi:hypothetical protein